MLKRLLKNLLSQSLKKADIRLQRVRFTPAQKEQIDGFRRTDSWAKIILHLKRTLVTRWLHKGVNADFRDGWMACLHTLENLPVNKLPVTDDGEKTQPSAIWMEDDEQ